MAPLQTFFESVARAICETDWASTSRPSLLGDSLLAVVRAAHRLVAPHFGEDDLRAALREAVTAPQETVELELEDAVAALANQRAGVNRPALVAFLELFPPVIKQALRRPGDALGASVPEEFPVAKPEDWLIFFPDRLARFKAGEQLSAYDNWQVSEMRGLGTYSESWRGWSADSAANKTALLKFITDPRAAEGFGRHEEHFRRILDMQPPAGLVPLHSVYLLADPPCLESEFVSGYDAAALIRDWRWRNERCKPDRIALIIRRVAKIVGRLHALEPPLVHRGLKLSNILLHPTAQGKVTIWVSDIGWGEIATALCLERIEQAQAKRQARRGALASRYASPEQKSGLPPDPRDDIYALGVIWHQLIKRDPTAHAPEGFEWALEFRQLGLSDGLACLLASCLDPNPDFRPANGLELADSIDAQLNKTPRITGQTHPAMESSATIQLNNSESGENKVAAALAADDDLSKRILNSIGMEFALIGPGTFAMGSPPEEKGRRDWEGPVHPVTLTRPFYMGVYPVTQSQFRQVMGRNPSYFTRTLGGGPNHPVEQVSWEDAITFCERLMTLDGETEHGRIYRLPSEAEWEFACRAGTTTPYAFGATISPLQVHYFGLAARLSAKKVRATGKTVEVEADEANAWGLHGMHGNVLEWCNDWWSERYYEESPELDPLGPSDGLERVVRGGSFSQFASDCRSAARLGRDPESRLNTIGFRVVMTLPGR